VHRLALRAGGQRFHRGQPVTLLLHVTRNPLRTRVRHILRSRVVSVLNPADRLGTDPVAADLVRPVPAASRHDAGGHPSRHRPDAGAAYNAYLADLDTTKGSS
jgi:hypothetical protein